MELRKATIGYTLTFVFGLSISAIETGTAQAAGWPNWRGPNHNGISTETGWAAARPKEKAKTLWKAFVGTGFSSIAVSNGRAYTMGNINNNDILYCFDAETGKEVWKRSYPCPLYKKNHEGGPCATPTVDGDSIYTFSKDGDVLCFKAANGRVVWHKYLNREFSVKHPTWYFASSPLIIDNIIILNAGQIETEVGEKGEPLTEIVESMNRVNYSWPAVVAAEAVKLPLEKKLEIIAIGSIADGSPSCFGPVYHAGKIAVHYFWSGVGPIMYYASDKRVVMRLYRPGAIKGPLAWAPVNRLNEKGYKIRAKRVNGAPEADHVARVIYKWIEKGKQFVGTYDEPFSFKIFKYLHALFPNFFYKLQLYGWRKASKFYNEN